MEKEVTIYSVKRAFWLVTVGLTVLRQSYEVSAGSTCSYMGDIAHGKVVPRLTQGLGGVVRYSCDDGYRLVGQAYRYCTSSGWGGRPARCKIVDCGDPGTPANGRRFHSDFTFGKTVVYSCNSGYRIQGANTRKCTASGSWSGALPSCPRVPCPKLQPPKRGCVTLARDPVFGDTANYTCNPGAFLVGPVMRTCLSVGFWDGSDPLCNVTMCSRLPSPAHGTVQPADGRQVAHGTTATFSCDAGFVLNGTATRSCRGSGARGTWSNTQPTCIRRTCSELKKPVNGEKVGSTYVYQASVRYLCLPGYAIRGAETLTCRADGSWSTPRPNCTACPLNTYKAGSNAGRACTPCPNHSHTATNASGHVQLCRCDQGYKKAGSACIEIQCPVLPIPYHGSVTSCSRRAGGHCRFQCGAGYVLSSGSADRTCQSSGVWSGTQAFCQACPVNTYKSGPATCSACWPHSHTASPGGVTCTCDDGYLAGGQNKTCTDVNECQTNNGGCEQQCTNEPGSFRCACNLPGYKTDPADQLKCVAKQECVDFEPPENGGLVCIDIPSKNSRQCQVKCDSGFEHPDRVNEFELCGPETGWKWSFQTTNRTIPPCIPEFFPEIRLQTEIYYFTSECNKITNDEKRQIKVAFMDSLERKGICQVDGRDICLIESMYISCGTVTDPVPPSDTLSRRRRSSQTSPLLLKIRFEIVVPETATQNFSCSQQCTKDNSSSCASTCYQTYQNSSISSVNKAVTTINSLLEKNETAPSGGLKLVVSGRALTPARRRLKTARPVLSCSRGKVAHVTQAEGYATRILCVACHPGTYARSGECELCPPGTHQPRLQQTRCLPCPPRSTSAAGASLCTMRTLSSGLK